MPLGTLDRTPPPFFKQGLSAVSKLLLFAALSVLLMVADVRYQLAEPARVALAVVLYPAQWLARLPQRALASLSDFTESRDSAQAREREAQARLLQQAPRAAQVEQLLLENSQLRELLELRGRLGAQGMAAQVLYEAADPYTRKVIIDKGAADGAQESAAVMDAHGVLGQVTRVLPTLSEVTLITDREQATPVLNVRTGLRGVAYGDAANQGLLELRFMAANADVVQGDLLTTSGIDGVYPAGMPVARVVHVERRADSVFARVLCQPLGRVQGPRHVMVLRPLSDQLPPRPVLDKPQPLMSGKGRRR